MSTSSFTVFYTCNCFLNRQVWMQSWVCGDMKYLPFHNKTEGWTIFDIYTLIFMTYITLNLLLISLSDNVHTLLPEVIWLYGVYRFPWRISDSNRVRVIAYNNSTGSLRYFFFISYNVLCYLWNAISYIHAYIYFEQRITDICFDVDSSIKANMSVLWSKIITSTKNVLLLYQSQINFSQTYFHYICNTSCKIKMR